MGLPRQARHQPRHGDHGQPVQGLPSPDAPAGVPSGHRPLATSQPRPPPVPLGASASETAPPGPSRHGTSTITQHGPTHSPPPSPVPPTAALTLLHSPPAELGVRHNARSSARTDRSPITTTPCLPGPTTTPPPPNPISFAQVTRLPCPPTASQPPGVRYHRRKAIHHHPGVRCRPTPAPATNFGPRVFNPEQAQP